MAKTRLLNLAHELKIDVRELIQHLKDDLGLEFSFLSPLDETTVARVRQIFSISAPKVEEVLVSENVKRRRRGRQETPARIISMPLTETTTSAPPPPPPKKVTKPREHRETVARIVTPPPIEKAAFDEASPPPQKEVANPHNTEEIISQTPASGGNMSSREMMQAIDYLLNPYKFAGNQDTDQQKAFATVNESLKSYGLKVIIDNLTKKVKLTPIYAEFISTATEDRMPDKVITVCPEVFRVPEKKPQPRLVAVMMPFRTEFDQTYWAIKNACKVANLDCFRADDIWENTTFMQDIFELIYCSRVVVVDFSGKNPNVMYETGVAHTLGKYVIPITQSFDDVPSDLLNHRVLKYLPNKEGYASLQSKLQSRLLQLVNK